MMDAEPRFCPARYLSALYLGLLLLTPSSFSAQETLSPAGVASSQLPDLPLHSGISGRVVDTDGAAIPNAGVTAEDLVTKSEHAGVTDTSGDFAFASLPPGSYRIRIKAQGFAQWKVEDVQVRPEELTTLTTIELGVEALDSSVDAISQEDLAEQQITAEEHQRILGILPNFFVSYVPNAAPLTRKQKFKLAFIVSTDPVTFFTNGVNAGIEQAQGDYQGYGQGVAGYARRYGAGYGDRLSSTFFGAAILPSLFHQDPRYFYKGTGNVAYRALYAISTVVICKGDNGHWQPNYSNVLGNLIAGAISSSYYPRSEQHSVQVTVSNTLLGTAEGAFGTLFQEFLLRHLTKGAPPVIKPSQP